MLHGSIFLLSSRGLATGSYYYRLSPEIPLQARGMTLKVTGFPPTRE
ncbi:hypothetical protein [Rickettsia asembonensis]|nr:hypothetical protein [Rickettsia asembonensis]